MTSIRLQLHQIVTKVHFLKRTIKNESLVRHSSYYSSPFLEDVGEITTKYEVTRIPEEWKFVERVLPPGLVPEPVKKPEYPSGWKPQGDDFTNSPYFIARTRNHMMPVYLKIMQRGHKRHTIIRKIQGDIWQLEKHLRPFLEDLIKPKPLRLQVDEFAGKICINGDHVNAIKYWLSQRNF